MRQTTRSLAGGAKISGPDLIGVHMLRGIAALAVLVHHTLEETSVLIAPAQWLHVGTLVGASGVDLFFVISGFIMLYTTERRFGQPGAGADFAARRLIRILPLYWLCTLLVVALAATGWFYRSKVITATDVALSMTLMPTSNLIHGVGWTLQYEMYFYLLFTLAVVFCTARIAVVAIPLTLVAIIGLVYAALPDSPARSFFTDPISLEFAYGLIIAYAFRHGVRTPIDARVLAGLGLAGLVFAACIGPSNSTNGLAPHARFLLWGIPAAFILTAALTVKAAGGRLSRSLTGSATSHTRSI